MPTSMAICQPLRTAKFCQPQSSSSQEWNASCNSMFCGWKWGELARWKIVFPTLFLDVLTKAGFWIFANFSGICMKYVLTATKMYPALSCIQLIWNCNFQRLKVAFKKCFELSNWVRFRLAFFWGLYYGLGLVLILPKVKKLFQYDDITTCMNCNSLCTAWINYGWNYRCNSGCTHARIARM